MQCAVVVLRTAMHWMMSACAHTTLQQGVLMPPAHVRADAEDWREPAMDGSALLGLQELKVLRGDGWHIYLTPTAVSSGDSIAQAK